MEELISWLDSSSERTEEEGTTVEVEEEIDDIADASVVDDDNVSVGIEIDEDSTIEDDFILEEDSAWEILLNDVEDGSTIEIESLEDIELESIDEDDDFKGSPVVEELAEWEADSKSLLKLIVSVVPETLDDNDDDGVK